MPIVILVAAVGLLALMVETTGAPTMEKTGIDQATAEDAIVTRICAKLPAAARDAARRALLTQAIDETANFTAHYLASTHSLWNRHKGDGRLGVPNSDGFWTGRIFYVSPADPDLRVYTDFYQCADDMWQWLNEPRFSLCKAALVNGDAAGYFDALDAVGFSTLASYGSDLKGRYARVA